MGGARVLIDKAPDDVADVLGEGEEHEGEADEEQHGDQLTGLLLFSGVLLQGRVWKLIVYDIP